ncbi:MAG: T9SS type A sorting domain-containing protein, partial [Bacteroidales bacterium]|nr:T9SS type A sorting domain-containing protein [Bacteroidales bacterium]
HNWTKVDGSGLGGSVYNRTMDGSNVVALLSPCAVKDGGTYHMWYTRGGYEPPNFIFTLGYATSTNGLDWTNVPGPGTNGAVLDLGEPGKFDELWILYPSVIKEDNEFKMWYTGRDTSGSIRIGYATSSDAINWTKVDGNGTNGACFDEISMASSVIKIGDTYRMWYLGVGGMCYATSEGGTGIEDFNSGKILTSFALAQNYPNPFNPTTRILYVLPSSGFVSLKVYDLIGREIQTLVSEVQAAGTYAIDFNANELTGGIYFYRLQIGGKFIETRKMILIK